MLALLAGTQAHAQTAPYALKGYIPIPASADNALGGQFATFDIGAFDGTTQTYYLSDRSNAAIDMVSAATGSFLGRIGGSGHMFTGQKATNGTSGPNGLLLVNTKARHQVFAGNADSTLLGFDLPLAEPVQPVFRIATGTPDQNRVDEITLDPDARTILAGNNATEPNFASLLDIDTASPDVRVVRTKIVFDGVHGGPVARGVEASAFNATTKSFFLAVQHLGTDPAHPGGLVEIDALDGKVLRVMDFGTAGFGSLAHCAPSGISAARNGHMIVGCSVAGQSIVIDPAGPGRVVATVPQISGVDQIDYDPTTDRWFLAARDNPGGPVLGVVDAATNAVLQVIPTTFNAHSVAVDPVSGQVFVPEGAHPSNTNCPQGCIAVFQKTPG